MFLFIAKIRLFFRLTKFLYKKKYKVNIFYAEELRVFRSDCFIEYLSFDFLLIFAV